MQTIYNDKNIGTSVAEYQVKQMKTISIDKNVYSIKLTYKTSSCKNKEKVRGNFPQLKHAVKDYYIQIQSKDNTYTGKKIKLVRGQFQVYVSLEKESVNSFWVYLLDNRGYSLSITQDDFCITQTKKAPSFFRLYAKTIAKTVIIFVLIILLWVMTNKMLLDVDGYANSMTDYIEKIFNNNELK